MDLVGNSLGHYQVTSLLAHGDTAELYLGKNINTNRRAALKILPFPIQEEARQPVPEKLLNGAQANGKKANVAKSNESETIVDNTHQEKGNVAVADKDQAETQKTDEDQISVAATDEEETKVAEESESEQPSSPYLLASEARLLARFKHLHIIRVLDFGKHEDTVYLAQEYVRTGSLRQHYPQGTQLSQKIILGYIKQIAETLYYLHGLKVLHRHLKPEHLLLAPGNRVVLCGFGQAFSPWEEDNTTAIKGSRTYMAPEQFQQTSLPASDQYALAAITYEWFCGEPPFTGSPSELEAQHQHTPPPSMVEKRIKLSPAIEQAVLLALAKEPQHRFANVNAFAHALEQACVEGS